MLNLAMFGGFLVTALAIQLAPGPGMLFVVANGVAGGPRTGVAVATGPAAGMLVHTTATALGLAAVLRAAPAALAVMKVIGALYLLWLAVRAFRAKVELLSAEPAAGIAGSGVRFWSVFGRGAINNLANPKVVGFYLVFLPQFVAAGNVAGQLFILGGTMLLIGLVIDVQIGVLAGRLGTVLVRTRTFRRTMNKITGTVYTALATRLLITS